MKWLASLVLFWTVCAARADIIINPYPVFASTHFAATVGGANPASKTFTVTTGTGQQWQTHDTSNWFNIKCSDCTSSCSTGASGSSFSICPDISGLTEAGRTYSEMVSINANGETTRNFYVTISMMAPAPTPSLTPTPGPTATPGAYPTYPITLYWDANTEPNLSGYKAHYGQTSGIYTRTVDVGNVSRATVPGFQKCTQYFYAMTAYNSSGSESGYSNELIATPLDVCAIAVNENDPIAPSIRLRIHH